MSDQQTTPDAARDEAARALADIATDREDDCYIVHGQFIKTYSPEKGKAVRALRAQAAAALSRATAAMEGK